jgi:ABC-type lipoprotein export system ATPase subunit
MHDILVSARNAGVEFIQPEGEKVRVLDEINCDIVGGDRIVLSGPSGSGKSTLLNILGGLIAPSEGTVTWPALGNRATLQPAKIAYVFQAESLFPALSVFENVMLPLKLMGNLLESEDAASVLLERLQLDGLSKKLPEELSGGQAQRVAMARALVVRPRLVLKFADEFEIAFVVATHDRLIADLMETRWSIDHGRLATPQSI